jgi:hypothetical protein
VREGGRERENLLLFERDQMVTKVVRFCWLPIEDINKCGCNLTLTLGLFYKEIYSCNYFCTVADCMLCTGNNLREGKSESIWLSERDHTVAKVVGCCWLPIEGVNTHDRKLTHTLSLFYKTF